MKNYSHKHKLTCVCVTFRIILLLLLLLLLLLQSLFNTVFYLSCPLHFSAVYGSSSEFIDISSLRTPFEKRIVRGVFIQSGFADSTGEDMLGPCPLGTFVDSSHTHPKCKNCSAGKL